MSKPMMEDLFVFSHGRRNRASFAANIFFFQVPVMFVLMFMMIGIGVAADATVQPAPAIAMLMLMPVVSLGFILIAIIGAAVSTQRLRDMGVSGWFYLAAFLPFIGFLFTIAMLFWPSEAGENSYGPSPLDKASDLES